VYGGSWGVLHDRFLEQVLAIELRESMIGTKLLLGIDKVATLLLDVLCFFSPDSPSLDYRGLGLDPPSFSLLCFEPDYSRHLGLGFLNLHPGCFCFRGLKLRSFDLDSLGFHSSDLLCLLLPDLKLSGLELCGLDAVCLYYAHIVVLFGADGIEEFGIRVFLDLLRRLLLWFSDFAAAVSIVVAANGLALLGLSRPRFALIL
jgi:hypothetical protein